MELSMMITIDRWEYEILHDYREALQEEAIQDRYSEILDKYDYILGDWGYGQLRLKGFLMIKIRRLHMIQNLVRFKIIYMNTVTLVAPILLSKK